tara:strand:- start:523 stop:726 length:204 start_codon:yes stop_codon:yes gene_type:complete
MNKETKIMTYLQLRKRKQKFANRMTMLLGSLLAIFGAAGLTATNNQDYLVVLILGCMATAVGVACVE